MLATITFEFDPLFYVGDISVRLQTIALAAVLFAALILLVRIGRVTPLAGPYVPPLTLRAADVPILVLGMVPGAVLGGRLDYVLVHLDYYLDDPASILDATQGSLGLGLAVPGAILGAAIIGRLIDTQIDRWSHASVLPMLFALGAGKFVGILAAEGQGRPTDLSWATAYLGDGPWSSLAASLPSHPAQVYEALFTFWVLVLVAIMLRVGAFARRDGSVLLVGVALWAIGRMIVATTWRDAAVLAPFGAEQLILGVVVVGCSGMILRLRTR